MLQTHTHIKNFYPCYYNYCGFVKLLSPSSYIRVQVGAGEFQVSKLKDIPNTVDGVIQNGIPCTEEEFKAGYLKAMSHVVHEAFMQQSEAATDKEIRESAEDIPNEIYERNEDLNHAVNQLSNHY